MLTPSVSYFVNSKMGNPRQKLMTLLLSFERSAGPFMPQVEKSNLDPLWRLYLLFETCNDVNNNNENQVLIPANSWNYADLFPRKWSHYYYQHIGGIEESPTQQKTNNLFWVDEKPKMKHWKLPIITKLQLLQNYNRRFVCPCVRRFSLLPSNAQHLFILRPNFPPNYVISQDEEKQYYIPSPCLIWEDPTMVLQGSGFVHDIHFYQEDELLSSSENKFHIFNLIIWRWNFLFCK